MFLCKPWSCLCVACFPEEDAEMKQISEFIALVNIDVDAMLLAKPAFFVLLVGVNGANKLAIAALSAVFAAGGM